MAEQLPLSKPSDHALLQTKSLALVQIFLNASLACVAHTRELIPWTSPSFRTRYIDQMDTEFYAGVDNLYLAFQKLERNSLSHGQEIRILVRGANRRADHILEMLERGVFEALEHGYLEALQVFVTRSDEPQTTLESYHFAFAYTEGRVSSIQLSPTSCTLVLENFQKSFKAAVRALLRSLKALSPLPARRRLGMSLVYNKTCPEVYQPPGFMDEEHIPDSVGKNVCTALWQHVNDVVGQLEAGCHRVTVGVHLLTPEDVASPCDPQDRAMSKQLQAMQKTSSLRSTNLISTMRDSGPRVKRQNEFVGQKPKRTKTTDGRAEPDGNLISQADRREHLGGTKTCGHLNHKSTISDAELAVQGSDVVLSAAHCPGSSSTPPRPRRKISLSCLFINVDRSPSAGSTSEEDLPRGTVGDNTHASGFSTDASTATAD